MLSNQEKKEMLEDAKSITRRDDFRAARASSVKISSLDGYFRFLKDVQNVFSPFKISTHPTITKLNKL